MAAEKITAHPEISSHQPVDVRNRLEEIWANADKKITENVRSFEKSTPPCPQDGSPGKFVGYEGSYTRVRGVFECQKGHRFYEG